MGRMSSPAPAIARRAARVVLLDPADRVLLLRCRSGRDDGSFFWITPGGGLDAGETHEQAALRELHEEVGLSSVRLGPHIWTRRHTFPWLQRIYCQHEQFYLCRLTSSITVHHHHQSAEERRYLTGHRWWSVDQILASNGESFAPRRLGLLLSRLLEEGPPATAIDLGM